MQCTVHVLRPGISVVAGESRKISEADRESFWRSKGEDSHILQEGVTGVGLAA